MSLTLSSTPAPLVARDLTKTYGDRVVLDGVGLVANPGRPLGLVGENGVGKSTLMRLLADLEPADGGSVVRPADLEYLGQEPAFADGFNTDHGFLHVTRDDAGKLTGFLLGDLPFERK